MRQSDYEYHGPRTSVSLARSFDATPETVFAAWITPEIACRWLFADEASETVCELDPRVGGSYEITRICEGVRYVAVGEYRQVERPRRLVFTFGMPQFAADFCTVSVEIAPLRGRTTVQLTQEGLPPGYEESTLSGWRQMFDLLETALAEQLQPEAP